MVMDAQDALAEQLEAADRIEQLREVLEEIANLDPGTRIWGLARAALEKSHFGCTKGKS